MKDRNEGKSCGYGYALIFGTIVFAWLSGRLLGYLSGYLQGGLSGYLTESSSEYLMRESFCGDITMAGSTSMEKLGNVLAESFMEQYPSLTVTVEVTGSSAGIAAALSGSVDIGNSSRTLQEEEKEAGAVENMVAIEAIVVITDAENPVTDLTKEQLIAVYTGKIRNWAQLGGKDEPIVVIGREAGSGTRNIFEGRLAITDACLYANEMDSTGAVLARTAVTPGAIGYLAQDVLNEQVHILTIDGVTPTDENILAGKYLLSRPLFMVTKGGISAQKREVQLLYAYLCSAEGKALIKKVGLIVPR